VWEREGVEKRKEIRKGDRDKGKEKGERFREREIDNMKEREI